jgi:hypothetical protein
MTKSFLLTTGLLMIASVSFADGLNYQKVLSRVCDGVLQAPIAGENIVFLGPQSLVGLAQKADDGCTLVNFHSYVTLGAVSVDGQTGSQIQVTDSTAMQRSSCNKDVKGVAADFKTAAVQENQVTLIGGSQCKTLVLVLK